MKQSQVIIAIPNHLAHTFSRPQTVLLSWALLWTLIFFHPPQVTAGQAAKQYQPDRYGVMGIGSYTYVMDEDISFFRAAIFASFDYDKVWRHRAPENMRWKLEFSTGLTVNPYVRNVTSLVMMAQYYVTDQGFTRYKIRPYVEAGVGGVYADFQVRRQGSRLMFNPQFGLGTDFTLGDLNLFLSLRHDHFSNADLNDENRAVNSTSLYLGYYF